MISQEVRIGSQRVEQLIAGREDLCHGAQLGEPGCLTQELQLGAIEA